MLSRNASCPCQSGLRYKHCCGSSSSNDSTVLWEQRTKRQAALNLQKNGRFIEALEAYDVILREKSDDWEVAHMRALALLQLGLLDDARMDFAALLSTPVVHDDGFWTNLGLLLASVCPNSQSSLVQNKLFEYRRLHPAISSIQARREQFLDLHSRKLPAVSVVMPTYMHTQYVSEAISSVCAQTRLPLELIVIDDGSTDGTADQCRAAIAEAPFPVTFIARENRGAAATLNQGIALARGEFIQLLNSDDRLPAERIEIVLASLLSRNADWGYTRVSYIDALGKNCTNSDDKRITALMVVQDAAVMSHTPGLAMVRANSAISSGNIMFRKSLWETLGGFHDYRYNHDWDFCLRATLESEPVLVPQSLYEYRIHDRNTIMEVAHAPRMEQRKVMADFVNIAQNQPVHKNPFAPTFANWGGEFLALLGITHALQYMPIKLVKQALEDPSSLTT